MPLKKIDNDTFVEATRKGLFTPFGLLQTGVILTVEQYDILFELENKLLDWAKQQGQTS